VDLDATLVASHSEKENAAPTFKRGFWFHQLCAFVDHGPEGTGEPLVMLLRPGNAGSNTAADHLVVIKAALAQLPGHRPGTRAGRKVLIRIDGAGSTHAVLDWLTGQRLSYSVGYFLPANTSDLLELIAEHVWVPAYDAHDEIRDGAWVAELTDLLHLDGWPPVGTSRTTCRRRECTRTATTRRSGSPAARWTPRPPGARRRAGRPRRQRGSRAG
jgi:hypothetical protein